MDGVVSIVNARENELEFDIAIQNVQYSNVTVRFVIETDSIHYGFPCEHGDGDKWTVTIPPLPNLNQAEHPFRFEVIVDGYYFEPHRGTVRTVLEPEVKSSSHSAPQTPVVDHISIKDTSGQQEIEQVEEQKPAKKPTAKKSSPKPKSSSKPKTKPKTEVVEDQRVEQEVSPTEQDGFANLAQQFLEQHSTKRQTQEEYEPEKDSIAKQIIRQFRESSHNRSAKKPRLGDVLDESDDSPIDPSEQAKTVRNIFRSVQRLEE